jgi:hypothetical protein
MRTGGNPAAASLQQAGGAEFLEKPISIVDSSALAEGLVSDGLMPREASAAG